MHLHQPTLAVLAAGTGGHAPAGHPNPFLAAIAVVVVLAVAYWRSLRKHPYTACRKCHGDGTARCSLFRRGRSFCPGCGGTRMVARLGTRLLGHRNRPPVPRGPVAHAEREAVRR